LVFPQASEAQVCAFAAALRVYLADPAHHFQLVECRAPQQMDLTQLCADNPLDAADPELCLDFLTPMSFAPVEKDRPWWLTTLALHGYLARAVPQLPPPPLPSATLTVMPWFWAFESHRHEPKSPGGSKREILGGMTGPLYLRGGWQPWEPWLRLAAEFLIGRGATRGQGAFNLVQRRTYFDRELANTTRYEAAWHAYVEGTDRGENVTHAMVDLPSLCGNLSRGIASGTWRANPATRFFLPKPNGEDRAICLLSDADAVVHRAMHGLLSPVLDRALEEASMGYRVGRSVETARQAIARAIRDGYDHVVESDIEDFFDTIPWSGLRQALLRVLPSSDCATLRALEEIIRTPVVDVMGNCIFRQDGVLQGSPLSPLLANVYLDPLDEAITARGYRFVRYGDDFVILTSGAAAAEDALAFLREKVAALGLTLKAEKTAIRPVLLGFRFLGMSLGGDFGEQFVESTALKRPIIIRTPYAFAGVDHDALVLKKDQHLIARVPFLRMSQLVFHGCFAISSRLIEICAKRRIPITLCSPVGHHVHTIMPESRALLERRVRHHQAFQRLAPSSRCALAAHAIIAKLSHHARWLAAHPAPEAREAATFLKHQIRSLAEADSVERIRGLEGAAARVVFPALRATLLKPEFQSPARSPHEKPDRWNALLDFAYSQLFSHLNALVRGEGLDPYLGFLHSPDDRFESLVADLQEPFRPRLDRWAVRCVNLGVIGPEDFELQGASWCLIGPAFPKLLDAFAKELSTRFADDPGTLGDIIHGQVLLFAEWADTGAPPRFWMPTDG
jgi:CRISPR-associated protein Cas1